MVLNKNWIIMVLSFFIILVNISLANPDETILTVTDCDTCIANSIDINDSTYDTLDKNEIWIIGFDDLSCDTLNSGNACLDIWSQDEPSAETVTLTCSVDGSTWDKCGDNTWVPAATETNYCYSLSGVTCANINNLQMKLISNDGAASDDFYVDYTYIYVDYTTAAGDSIPPYFTNNTPQNQTLEANVSLSYDINATDETAFDCFTVNDTTNFKINCDGLLENNTGLGVALYYLNITINDSSNNKNTTNMWVNITAVPDTTYPDIKLNNPIDYFNTSTAINFNCTPYDNVNVFNVSLYGNWSGGWHNNETNSTPISGSASIFTKDMDDGTYIWNCYACDNSSNCQFNETNRTITIDKTAPTFDQAPTNQNINFETSFYYDLNATDTRAFDTFYVNDTKFSIDNTGIITNATMLGVDVYYLNITINDTLNNKNSATISVTVNQIGSVIYAYIDEIRSNKTILENSSTWLNATQITGDTESPLELYINDTLINTGNMSIGNYTAFNNTGIYNITAKYLNSQNYTVSYESWFVNVSLPTPDSTPPTFDQAPQNQNINFETSFYYDLNASDETEFDTFYVNDTTNFKIDSTGILENNTMLGVAIYYLNITINDTSNNKNSATISVTVNQIGSLIYSYIDNLRANKTIQKDVSLWLNATQITGDTEAPLELYNNGTLINTGNTNIANNTAFNSTGKYNITAKYLNSQNYTASQESWFVNVTPIPDETAPTFDQAPTNQNIDFKTSFYYDLNATDETEFDTFYINDTDFNIDSTGILTNATMLGVNVYYLNITINDTSNNKASATISVTVNQIGSTIYSYIDNLRANKTTLENTSLWLNASQLTGDTEAPIELYINDTLINTGSTNIANYTAFNNTGIYNITAKYLNSQNYTVSYESWFVNVTLPAPDETPPTFDQAPTNQAIDFKTSFYYDINATDETEFDTFYVNDTTFSIDSTGILENNTRLAVALYHLNITINDSSNNKASATISVTVNQIGSLIYAYVDNTRSNKTTQVHTALWLNATQVTGDTEAPLELYNHGVLINTGHTNIANETAFNNTGIYNITAKYLNSQNYTVSYESWFVNVTPIPDTTYPDIKLNNPVDYFNTSTAINFNCTPYDNVNVFNVSLYGNWSGSWHNNETNSSPTNNVASIFIKDMDDGTYVWNCYACDNSSNCQFNETNRTITIDKTSPTFDQAPQNQTIYYLTSFYYDINATDTRAFDTFYVNDTTNFKIDSTGILENNTGLAIGLYYINITINDTLNNKDSALIWVNVTAESISFTNLINHSQEVNNLFSYDLDATGGTIDTFSLNDTSVFSINSATGLITNTTGLVNITIYYLNVTVNNTGGSSVSETFYIDITASTCRKFKIGSDGSILFEINCDGNVNATGDWSYFAGAYACNNGTATCISRNYTWLTDVMGCPTW